jgi:hypothetical protein
MNLRWFFLNQLLYVVSELGWFWVCYQIAVIQGYSPGDIGWKQMFWVLSEHEPILWGMLCWHLFHFSWMILLFGQHLYQISTNLTSNEMYNYSRYDYLKDPDTVSFHHSQFGASGRSKQLTFVLGRIS